MTTPTPVTVAPAARTWTEHTSTCRGCGKKFRASQEAIDTVRAAEGYAITEMTDAQIVEGFDFCLSCVEGPVEGEHVEPTAEDVLAQNRDELEPEELAILGDWTMEGAEKSRLLAFADRLGRRLAEDDYQITALTDAAKREVTAITQHYEREIAKPKKRADWKRFVLEGIARLLFPDANAKPKSVNLPYVTLGRKDRAPAPDLVDESAAVIDCITKHPDLVVVTLKLSHQELEDRLVTFAKKVDKDSKAMKTVTASAQEFIQQLIELGLEGESGIKTTLALKWGDLKKLPSTKALAELDTKGLSAERKGVAGVTIDAGETTFYASLTEG